MFKFVVLAACVFSANAGLIASPGIAIASGPALGATLLGRTTVTAPETTIVKQQITVDQPEIRVRAIPHVVQTAPIVQTIAAAPAVVAAPAVRTIAAPTVVAAPALRTIAAPQLLAPQVLAAPALPANTIQTLATPWGLASSQLIAGVQSQTLLASPTTLLGAQQILLKK